MILAGDIGGTKVHLALYDLVGGRLSPVRGASFATKDFDKLEEIVLPFVGADPISAACFWGAWPEDERKLENGKPAMDFASSGACRQPFHSTRFPAQRHGSLWPCGGRTVACSTAYAQ